MPKPSAIMLGMSPDQNMPPPRYPRRRADLEVAPVEISGTDYFVMKDPVSGRMCRLRAPEYWLWDRLDGETPLGELAARFSLNFQTPISVSDISSFVATLDTLNLTIPAEQAADAPAATTEMPRANQSFLHDTSRQFRFTEIYLGTINPRRLIERLTTFYRPLHSPAGAIAAGLILLTGVTIFALNFGAFSLTYDQLTQASSLGLLLLAMFVMISIHELAHAVLLTHYGGKVTRMGFMLLYLQPCFYCDVSDAWLLGSRRQRMAVSAAGLAAQGIILALGAILWRVCEPMSFPAQFARGIVVVSWINFFFNANPLIRLDGYYLLIDYWGGIANLRELSRARVRHAVRRGLGLGVAAPAWDAKFDQRLLWYGRASILFQGVLLAGSIWFFGGLAWRLGGSGGVVLYGLLVAAMLVPSGWRAVRRAANLIRELMDTKTRLNPLYFIAPLTAIFLGWFLLYPLTHTTGGEIQMQSLRHFDIRLTSSGLLEREEFSGGAHPARQTSFLQPASNDIASLSLIPRVADGAVVRSGDTLAIFASNEVTRQLQEAQAELARLQSELALIKAPPKKERINEARTQIDAAKAELAQKQNDLTRAESLAVRGLIPAAELESHRTSVAMAEATVRNRISTLELVASPPRPQEESVTVNAIDKQHARLDFLRSQAAAQSIISPLSGVAVVSRDGTHILSVRATDTMEAAVPVAENDLPLVWMNQPARIKVKAHAALIYQGTVARVPLVGSPGDSSHSSFLVSVLVPNTDGSLREGMDGYAKIEVGKITPAGLLWRKLMSVTRVELWGLW